MRDVRNIQAMLSEGITDTALLYRQLEAGGPFEIPDDGLDHRCPCGEQTYRVDHHWAWGPHPTDIEGRWVGSCWGCGRDLIAVKPKEKR